MRVGVVTFPGSLDDGDAARAVRLAGAEPVRLWHADADLHGVDAVVLPGGFSYGDYLRCGAIARFAHVMTSVIEAAGRGTPVLGICNGFQVLCESHLLPGALTRNQLLRFVNRDQALRISNRTTAWTTDLAEHVTIPVKNGEGAYVADEATLDRLEGEGLVVAYYDTGGDIAGDTGGDTPGHIVRGTGGNPNGSLRDIAGITNARGNVVGLMPHPEHAVEALTGPGTDGLGFFTSVLTSLASR